MIVYLRKLRGVIGIGLFWIPLWVALFFILMAGIMALRYPDTGSSDVGPIRWITIMSWVGFVSGAIFGILMSFAEHGKAIRSLSAGRAALWGILGAAVFPLLTGRENQIFWTCPFGAIVAVTLVALARKAELRASNQAKRLPDFLFAIVLATVSDAVGPSEEAAIGAKATMG